MTETNEKVEPKPIDLGEYKYGFHDDVTPVFSTGKGISEDVVRAMSAEKGEPEWMLEFRLKSLETFNKMAMQEWGPDLSGINFDDLTYFQKASDKPARDWEDVPEKIKETFERIGIPEAERAYLAGASAQYESEVVFCQALFFRSFSFLTELGASRKSLAFLPDFLASIGSFRFTSS